MIKTTLQTVALTLGTIWTLNYLAAMNPQARKLIRGTSVQTVNNPPGNRVTGSTGTGTLV